MSSRELICITFLFVLQSERGNVTQPIPDLNKIVTLPDRQASPAGAIALLGAQESIPMAIIDGSGNQLCRSGVTIDTKAPIRQMLNESLSKTNYSWHLSDGVVFIQPDSLDPETARILEMKIERFSSMPPTLPGLGVILNGYISAQLHPERGYAGNILSSSESEIVPPFVMEHASVAEIANHIVNLSGRGIWTLDRTFDMSGKSDGYNLSVYAYKNGAGLTLNPICNASMR